MKLKNKRKLPRRLLITQLSIYAFIILHSIAWHVFGIHIIPKLCPGKFAAHIGSFELNFNVVFWGLIFLSTFFVGRAFCSWGCMWGAYQDFVYRLFKKLKVRGIKGKPRVWIFIFLVIISGLPFLLEKTSAWPTLFWFYVLVIVSGFLLWLIVERKALNKNFSVVPRYILLTHFLGSIVSAWIIFNVFRKGFSLALDKYGVLDEYKSLAGVIFALVGFGLAALAVAVEKRFFCKYICPYGLLLRFLSLIPGPNRYKVRATENQCNQCSKCNRNCPMNVKPMEEILQYGEVKNSECINCLNCVAECPQDSLDFKRKES